MKRIIFLVIAIATALSSWSQNKPTLHAIIFADTYDDKIGAGAYVSKTQFGDLLVAIADSINYDYEFYWGLGDACRKATLIETLDNFHCDTADIVVFCYLGHGVRSINDTSIFPQMCLHEKDQKDFVPLEYVKKRLAEHGARVTLVIGDCCNSYSEFTEPKTEAAGATKLPGAATNLINQLFTQFTGVVTMCASKPGSFGWCNSVTGMYFNNELIRAIQSPNINSIIPNRPWSSVMNMVMKSLSGHIFYKMNDPLKTPYKMEPRYRIEPRKKPTPIPYPKPDASNLQKELNKLTNNSQHTITRMHMIPDIMKNNFSENAIIRTVSKSGKFAYGEPYSAKKYLEKLSKSESIIAVIIRKEKRDSLGKITYLEVHEMYKEQ